METNMELFERLYCEHGVSVKRFIYTQARRDTHATDDIFQATWENVFRYMNSLQRMDAAKSWLFSIAKNEAARYYSSKSRKYGLKLVDMGDEDFPDIVDEGSDSFPDAIADTDRLAKLLGSLHESEQQLILLHYSYDMSLTDIAELIGANYNTVKSVMRRAKAKLRKLAEAFGDE
jgi:RNA polymerase sigma-70 factor (ECF subfamily)